MSTRWRLLTTVLCALVCCPQTGGALAQSDTVTAPKPNVRAYTEEHPLVYEDVWDLWPYSYLNDNGEPEGFNIDLIRLMMDELDIPYIIRLKPSEEAFNDLKEGKSDLMLGLAVGFHDEYGLYGKNAVTLFTQSVVTPKGKPIQIKTFRDLGRQGMRVIVNSNSLCYHLMQDYGWQENAIPEKDIREVIQQVSAREDGQIVWNTLTLKWLMNRYRIDNLQLTPVNMPHGEYKFMSNNQDLLDLLDDCYVRLGTAEKLTPLQTKWFYPERVKPGLSPWFWYLVGVAAVLLLILLVYAVSYRIQIQRLNRQNSRKNARLGLILETSLVNIWTYDISTNQFSWRNENGQVAYTYSMEEFSQRYSPNDFQRLKKGIDTLAATTLGKNDAEQSITLNLRARDMERGGRKMSDYVINLAVLRRDSDGKAAVIIGTKKDVTEECEKRRREEERTLRYWSIFYTPIVGIMLFDKDGLLVNINPKACEMYDCDPEAAIEEHISIRDFIDDETTDLRDLDGFHATQCFNVDRVPKEQRRIKSFHHKGRLYNEFRLIKVDDDLGDLLGIFVICRDVTDSIKVIAMEQEGHKKVAEAKEELADRTRLVNHLLGNSDIRLVKYSPESHTFTIYSGAGIVQHALTQTRCMTLVDERSQKTAMRMLNDMDAHTDKVIETTIQTTLRNPQRLPLYIYLKMEAVSDKNGQIAYYRGLLRDVSELRDVELQMARQTAKVEEVEATKNAFIKNMVQEIRTPMNTVLDYVNRLSPDTPTGDESALSQGILNNADYLLHLIDNILYLSRLEARMVEIRRQERNFAELFETQCMNGWEKHQNARTTYQVENPYEQLVVDIDAEAIGQAIAQVTSNAAQYTESGTVRARYDYIGRRLVISVDDTGNGIPPEELARINESGAYTAHGTKGLGIAIAKELISQMGGTMEYNSEVGSGTTVYMTIPCHVSFIKRKRIV